MVDASAAETGLRDGERLTLTLDETLVLDDRLQTEDWSTALSRYMELPIRPSTTMVNWSVAAMSAPGRMANWPTGRPGMLCMP